MQSFRLLWLTRKLAEITGILPKNAAFIREFNAIDSQLKTSLYIKSHSIEGWFEYPWVIQQNTNFIRGNTYTSMFIRRVMTSQLTDEPRLFVQIKFPSFSFSLRGRVEIDYWVLFLTIYFCVWFDPGLQYSSVNSEWITKFSKEVQTAWVDLHLLEISLIKTYICDL